jgi:PAS domain S-box-containing protein
MIEEQEFYWKLLDTLKDGVYFTNQKRKITYWNKGAEELTGYKSSEVLGKFCGDNILIHIDEQGNNLCTGSCPLEKVLKSGETTVANIYLHHKDGHRVPVLVRVNPVKDKKSRVIGAVEIFSDRSLRDIIRERMEDLDSRNLLDENSGLPNHDFMEKKLKTRFWEFHQYNWPFGILYIQLEYPADRELSAENTEECEVMKILSQSFLNNINPFDIVGHWEQDGLLGIFGNVDESEVRGLEKFYRLILAHAVQAATAKGVKIRISAVLAETRDSETTIIDRAKKALKPLV